MEAIKRRAHQLWEEEGRPHGRHEHHWQQAEAELIRTEPPSTATQSGFAASNGGLSTTLQPGGIQPAGGQANVGSLGTGGASTGNAGTGSQGRTE